ncbi:DNA-directed primase/polymerase protein-like [Mizuhopecten yessoensis]|uniref:DNA-directed primase/polymerase protein-like n=1 Tax=Mizuhopecten yessoensis TaxID=6573 RepID=UPI000B45D766|nr:DNA-directed primase/polymerase protein-like [Mizuhopecten yessoensis]
MSDTRGISSFYGGKQKRQWSKLEAAVNERVKKHHAEKIPDTFKQTISGPSVKWKTFFKQQDAFLYARSQAADLHVFAFESEILGSESGQRQYLVTSYPVFWHYYSQLKKSLRHHYEVIPESAVCKLYFDLEFIKEHNPDRDGDCMVDVFIKYISFWLKNKFGIRCDRKDVLDLDASTKLKFSRHLLYVIPAVAFRDNIHAGNFVHFVASELRKQCCGSGNQSLGENMTPRHAQGHTENTEELPEGVTAQDLESLMVKNKDGEDVLFCDLGVYTKNRNFRLYLSCKLGKDNPLVLSPHNLYSPHPTRHKSAGSPKHTISTRQEVEEDKSDNLIFMNSLIANVQYQADTRILTFDSERIHHRSSTCHKDDKPQTTELLDGHQHSQYPELDDYITSCVQRNGTRGYIRHWMYFPQGEIIVYEIGKNRWCENIGRPHKSNNIMMIADLKKAVYYQKCHDPDCKMQNFKSPDYPLPKEVLLSSLFDESEIEFEGETDDQECLQAIMEMESSLTEVIAPTGRATSEVTSCNGQHVDRPNHHQSNTGVGCKLGSAKVTDTAFENNIETSGVKDEGAVTSIPSNTDRSSGGCGVSAGTVITNLGSRYDEDCWDGDDDLLTAVMADDLQK